MTEFSDITQAHISSLPLPERKRLGQYMTPASIGDVMADMLSMGSTSSPKVLDPACGTGELLLAAKRACPSAMLHGFDVDLGMVSAACDNLPEADIRELSIFSPESRFEYGKYDYVIGNPPYFEMKKGSPELGLGGIDGFASLNDKGRLNIYALFIEYALRLVKVGGKVSYLIPPSMNNGAFFKCLRKRILELGVIRDIQMIRENDSFDNAMTSVQILLLERTANSYEKNLNASVKFVHNTGSTVIFTDQKETIEEFSRNKQSIFSLGFQVKTGTVIWNNHKEEFSEGETSSKPSPGSWMRTDGLYETASAEKLPVLFAKDISTNNAIVFSDKISANGHWLTSSAAKAVSAPAIIVNRIIGSLDHPRLRFALVKSGSFFGENHVNVITREDADAEKIRALYSALSSIESDSLSGYLQAVSGNTQLSATELSELPVKLPFKKPSSS